MCVCVFVRIYICIYMYMYMYIYIYIYTYIRIYDTHVDSCVRVHVGGSMGHVAVESGWVWGGYD